jgi:hypothetical protein
MKENNTDETFFREIMSESKLKVPFSDFDDNVMTLIEKKFSRKASISRDLKLSWIFFIIGSVFGIIISIVLPDIHEPVLGIQIDKLTIPFQIIFTLLLISQLDNLISFYNKRSQKN